MVDYTDGNVQVSVQTINDIYFQNLYFLKFTELSLCFN